MRILAIDTATDDCALTLGEESRVTREALLVAGRSHLELLLPAVHDLLGESGWKVTDIEGIVVGTGPGTFTGLRVGVATARGLAQGLGIPIAGASTLRALALGMLNPATGDDDLGKVASSSCLLPLIDAKRGQVFTQLFRRADGRGVVELSGVACLDPAELPAMLAESGGPRVLAAGNGALAYRRALAGMPQIKMIDPEDGRHRVQARFHLPEDSRGSFAAGDLPPVLPVYGRRPDADRMVLLRKREPWQQ